MRSMTRMVVASGLLFTATALAQNPPTPNVATKRAASFAARLKDQASKTSLAKLSPPFKALDDAKDRPDLRLSSEQVNLVGQLGELTCDIVKTWLLRDLDADPPPTPATLSERLSAGGDRLRAHVVAEAEAIVYECILKPEQARLLRTATGHKPFPFLPGRDGPPEFGAADENRSCGELAENLRHLPGAFPDRTGLVSLALLGKPGMREEYRNGIDHLDPVRQQLARRDLPKVELAEEQIKLIERLDKTTFAIWRAWLLRDLDKTPLPPQSVLAQRLWQGGERFHANLISRAELIALQSILTPEQAEKALGAVWKQCGMRALLDPALAARLRLTRSQREEILSLLDAKKEMSKEMSESVRPLWRFRMTNPEARRQVDQMMQDTERRQQEVDEQILTQVLTAAQARALTRILNRPDTPAREQEAKVKKSKWPR
jgi:hypothetical protein